MANQISPPSEVDLQITESDAGGAEAPPAVEYRSQNALSKDPHSQHDPNGVGGSQRKTPMQKLDMSHIAPDSQLPLVEQHEVVELEPLTQPLVLAELPEGEAKAAVAVEDSDDKFWENWKSDIPEHLIGDPM